MSRPADRRISKALRQVASNVDQSLRHIAGERVGFSLFVWTDGRAQYVSNCERVDIAKAITECLDRWSTGMQDVPLHQDEGRSGETAATTISGKLPTATLNALSDVIANAVKSGQELDEILSLVVTVAADYARGTYGDDYLPGLAGLLLKRAGQELPGGDVIGHT